MSRRGLLIGAVAVLTAGVASANFHFVHYAGHGAPYTPVFEQFDLDSQPGGVVQYFIQPPPSTLQFSSGDTFPSLVSQIRAATEVWNSVGTSTFRFQFGGMATPNITMNTPAVLVSFDEELPPGIIAMGGPITRGDMATPEWGQWFVPIVQSTLVLGTNMRSPNDPTGGGSGPSWSDRLFLTLVHELGHTVGLQHTWTSGVMSTEITRAMTKAHPLGADDIAAISMLYPSEDWAAHSGTITGQVMLGNQGVNLASVVALTATGEAISTLTNPDGTYELDGLNAGAFQVYVHALPPSLPSEMQPVNLVLPVGDQGSIAPGPAFNTIFQTGTASPGAPVQVTAGQATAGVNFSVTQRASASIYDVQTYSFFWNVAVQKWDREKPATFLLGYNDAPYVVASGPGLLAADGVSPAPGLSVSVLGGPGMIAPGAVKAYPYDPGHLQFDLSLGAETVPGPRHLVFTRNGETEVLPSGLLLSLSVPPSISKITQNSDGTATISGSGLDVGTRILFDGAPAAVRQVLNGTVTAVPPPAQPGASAAVIALSPSGLDSSSFDPAADPPFYSYANNGSPSIRVAPDLVSSGSDAVLDLTGTNVDFAVSGLRLGFGTSDIVVNHVWLLSPQHAKVEISVSPTAPLGSTTMTLMAGLQLVENPLSLRVVAPSQLPTARLEDAIPSSLPPGLPYSYPIFLPLENVPTYASVASFSVVAASAAGEAQASVIAFLGGPILVFLPPYLTPGPLILKISYNGMALPPVAVDVSAVDPLILQAVNSATGSVYSESSPAYPGDLVSIQVRNLAADIAPVDLTSLAVSVGGAAQTLYAVQSVPDASNLYTVQFKLNPGNQFQGGSSSRLPVTIATGSRVSAPFMLPGAVTLAPR